MIFEKVRIWHLLFFFQGYLDLPYDVLPAYLLNIWYKGDFNESGKYTAPNPPMGAVIDYFIPDSIKATKEEISKHQTPVKIEISDDKGIIIDTLYGTEHKGINRIIWNLNYLSGHFYYADTINGKHPNYQAGPTALPGNYKVKIEFNGSKETQSFELNPDPRLPYNYDEAKKQFAAVKEVQNGISTLNEVLNRIENIHTQIENIKSVIKLVTTANDGNQFQSILKNSIDIDSSLTVLKDTLIESKSQPNVGEDDIHYLSKFRNWILNLRYWLSSDYDSSPNKMLTNEMEELRNELISYLNYFNKIIEIDIPAFNKLVYDKNVPVLVGGSSIKLK